MSKRSQRFQRRAQDAYDTPESAVVPLIPHLPERPVWFWEPCAGAGKLAESIVKLTSGRLSPIMTDIEPRSALVGRFDALHCKAFECNLIITNPPWSRDLLHPMIDRFRHLRPTWLLFDADWAHTRQAASFLPYCAKIVSVGRVSWMENGTSGFDNCAWYLFQRDPVVTEFVGRLPAPGVAA